MRKVIRPAEPPCLSSHARQWTLDFLENRILDRSHKFTWRSKSCYQAICTQLGIMTQQHCTFCDGLFIESRETVEHFHPKTQSKYPGRAYDWNNLFLCCDACQGYKLEKFDERLLKPDDVHYDFGRYFELNYKTGEILPSSSPRLSSEDRERARISIEMYGLNKGQRPIARKRAWEDFQRNPSPILNEYPYRFFLE